MANLALILTCLLVGGYALLDMSTYPPAADPSLNAALYPRILVAVLLLLALLLAIKLCLAIRRRPKIKMAVCLPSQRPLLMICCMAGYCWLLSCLGYAIATALFAFTATLLFRGTPREGVLTGLGLVVFLEALFRGLFQVPLPPGLLNLL